MRKFEKLVLIIVGLLILSRFGAFFRDFAIAYVYGTDEITSAGVKNLKIINLILSSLVNFGCAYWLLVESDRAKLQKWIWSVFGLFFGLIGVAIYYLVSIYVELKIEKET